MVIFVHHCLGPRIRFGTIGEEGTFVGDCAKPPHVFISLSANQLDSL